MNKQHFSSSGVFSSHHYFWCFQVSYTSIPFPQGKGKRADYRNNQFKRDRLVWLRSAVSRSWFCSFISSPWMGCCFTVVENLLDRMLSRIQTRFLNLNMHSFSEERVVQPALDYVVKRNWCKRNYRKPQRIQNLPTAWCC